MRVFPFVWMIVTIVLGIAVLVTTWLDAMVQTSWFDDSQFAFPDGLAVWSDPILGAVGLALLVGGSIATLVVVNRIHQPIESLTGERPPARGWPRAWLIFTIGLGVVVFAMAILETVAFDRFYANHAILDGVPFGPRLIVGGLGVALVVGGILAALAAQGRSRPGSLIIKPLTV